ncbi:MAG TPA: SPFH domain-containing protein [Candidatus Paceibacterota bacterium]
MIFAVGLAALLVVLVSVVKFWPQPSSGEPQHRRGATWVVIALVSIWTGLNSFTSISVGSTGVGVRFQNVQTRAYTEGVQLVNPFLDFHAMSARRQVIEFHAGEKDKVNEDVVSLSSNNVPMTIDVTYAWQLNPRYAWWVYRHMGLDDSYRNSLIKQVARSATRAAAAKFTSDEATTSKRNEFTLEMEKEFSDHLVADLVRQGLPLEDAKQVFIVLPIQLRKALPPEKVLNAISDKAAAEQDLQRQVTLTAIARQEAERRSNEGLGVSKLFDELPKGFTAEQIAMVVNALANKEKADAFMKAVLTGNVNTMVIDGGPTSVQVGSK